MRFPKISRERRGLRSPGFAEQNRRKVSWTFFKRKNRGYNKVLDREPVNGVGLEFIGFSVAKPLAQSALGV